MFAPANQPRFTLTLDGDSKSDFKVLEFSGKEAISQPYRFDLELVSDRPDIDLETLLHREAFLSFDSGEAGIHGQIFRVGQGYSDHRRTHYQISLVPRLAYLGQRINQRIFQHQSVQAIITLVLKEHGILGDAFNFQLDHQYPEREYCVQYAESDLAFIQRLCAEIGFHYHFRHSPDGHLLVFADHQTGFTLLPEPTVYRPRNATVADQPVIKRFDVRFETRTTKVSRRDYDFLKPHLDLESRVGQKQSVHEDYQFPGQFAEPEHGKRLAQRALERHGADYQQAEGLSDQPALISGTFLRLAEHPQEKWNDLWLITQTEHRGRQPQVLEESTPTDNPNDFKGYQNTFLATPWYVLFRPPLGPEKPRMLGYQSAVVTGPKDSEIHCDAFGRVKVQLAWDREGERDEHSSCWLRVASGWAHDRYGSVMIPRVGMEVLVGFIDADADKPLVMGCVPNAANPMPLNLPADKTRSVFRSQTSPGGGGYNEVRIEDRKGAEEIYLRAQRNWNQHVLNDQHVQVGNQRHVVIGGDQSQGASDNLRVHGDQSVRVNNQNLEASGHFHVRAGQQVVIDGGASLSIQAGGHWINIGPGGIFSSVEIELGGALMPVMGAAPPKVVPAALSPAQIRSLKSPAPFCEECERCKDGLCLPPNSLLDTSKAAVSEGAEPGFHIVEQPMSRAALESLLFPQPTPAVIEKFRRLNPQVSGYAKPGQLIVLSDPGNTQCTREEALLMEAAQTVDAALEPMSDAEAEFMARHHDEVESFLTQGSTGVGIGAAMFGTHLGNVQKTLVDIEALHKRTFEQNRKLTGADFYAERQRLMKQLDNGLGPLVRKGIGIPDHLKLKNALGISTRSLVRHWKQAGTAGGIPGYATHIEGVSRASKVIKAGGYVGIGLGAAASGLKVKETCRVGTEEACRKVKFTEAGKFSGNVALGAIGGVAGATTCVLVGIGTAGIGGIACGLVLTGVGTVLGGAVGAELGELGGELVYEVSK